MATSRFLSTPLWSAIPHGLPNLHHPRIQQLEAAAARCHPATAPLPPRHRPLPPAAARHRPTAAPPPSPTGCFVYAKHHFGSKSSFPCRQNA